MKGLNAPARGFSGTSDCASENGSEGGHPLTVKPLAAAAVAGWPV